MNRMKWTVLGFCIIFIFVLGGCGSSEESTQKKESTPPPAEQKPAEQTAKSEQPAPAKIDTVNVVNVQTAPKPTYEPKTTPPAIQSSQTSMGNFSVQIGAYKTEENAERAASLAKERLGINVQTVTDKTDYLFKVLVGSFLTREEARKLRDEIALKYPGDYKDAWVKEMVQK